MSDVCQPLRNIFKKRGVETHSSDSAKKVLKFDKSEYSDALYDFLTKGTVNRIVFNSLVKQRIINPNSLKEVKDLLKAARLSLIYIVTCKKCKNIIERVHILDADFSNKNSSCPSCSQSNKISKKDYKPDYENLNNEDLWRCLLELCQNQLFYQSLSMRCLKCNTNSNQVSENRNCPKCGKVCLVSTALITFDKNLDELVKSGDGYWLEWYVWKLVRKKFKNCEPGMIIKSSDKNKELDIVLLFKNSVIAIECKDGSENGFVHKLHWIKKYVDKFVLVSTDNIKEDILKTAKKVMGRKFCHVCPDSIENIAKILSK